MRKSHLLTEVHLYSASRQHSTQSLLDWQTNLHTPCLSLWSKQSRLSMVWQWCGSLFCTANSIHCIFCYCVFPVVALKTMLEWLQEVQQWNGFDKEELRRWWYDIMERWVPWDKQVLEVLHTVSHWFLTFQSSNYHHQMRQRGEGGPRQEPWEIQRKGWPSLWYRGQSQSIYKEAQYSSGSCGVYYVINPQSQSKVIMGRLGPVVILRESRWNPTGADFDMILTQ